jgi:polyisoprenoid-binding protein YceI
MLKKTLLATFLISSAITLFAQIDMPAGQYKVVPEESRIDITTGTAGLFGFAGHPHTIVPSMFSGDVVIKRGYPNSPAVSIRIQAPSLKETGDFNEKEKVEIESQMHGTVLESAKYPEITFQSTSVKYTEGAGHVYEAQIEGTLALHGVTREIMVPARITMNGNTLRVTGTFKIDRPDYKIETKSAGGGTVKVAKTIDIKFLFILRP